MRGDWSADISSAGEGQPVQEQPCPGAVPA